MENAKIILMIGLPAAGKSTYVAKLKKLHKNSIIISRDVYGGTIQSLVPIVVEELEKGKVVIIDNTNITLEQRKLFIDVAKSMNIEIDGIYIRSNIEDCQIRELHRMYDKYQQIFMTGTLPNKEKDPHVFPPATLFSARKILIEPEESEGFNSLITIDAPKIKWNARKYKNKAIFFDLDGTLRKTDDLPHKYPLQPSEVKLLHDAEMMKKVIKNYQKIGYKVFGVSNQSGISKGVLTQEDVVACMDKTKELLGVYFEISFCPHRPAPISCYCRKPQVGMIMTFIEEYLLNPKKCIMVGDMKVDETLASRMGIKYYDVNEFWKKYNVE